MAEDMGERTEDATSKRLSDARERGQVARSQDLGAAAGLIAGTVLVIALSGFVAERSGWLARSMFTGWAAADEPVWAGSAAGEFRRAMFAAGVLIAPFLAGTALVAAVAQFAQVGPLFTLRPLEPKLDRLDPVKGLGRLLAMKNLVRSAQSVVKASAGIALSYAVIARHADALAALPGMRALDGMGVIAGIATELAAVLCALMLVIGVADYLYQRWQHRRDLRMTKSEVQDERRSMEGDVGVKRRRLEIYRRIVANQIQSATPVADVVVTNPTHYAVALRYDPVTMRAPRVTAKGADLLALHMRRIAAAHRVPVVERPPLARALYRGVEVGREISPEHYAAVAEVLAYVYRVDERAREGVARGDAA